MKIQIDPHTLERAVKRGTYEVESKNVMTTGFAIPAKYGRRGRAKIYDFKRTRQGNCYEQKRSEVFYTVKGDLTVAVTARVFYGNGERGDPNSV